MGRTMPLPIGSFDALECRGDSLYIKGGFTDLSPYGEPMEVGICSPGTTLWRKRPDDRYEVVGFATPFEQAATQPRPQPSEQSTDWTCPACGKVNLREQRACGAGEWDGCGGPRVSEVDGEVEEAEGAVEEVYTVNSIDDSVIYCNGLPITGAKSLHVDARFNIITVVTDGMGQSSAWMEANTSDIRIIDIDILSGTRPAVRLRGWVQQMTENQVSLAISGHYPRDERSYRMKIGGEQFGALARTMSTRNYYMEITGAESMQEQFEEIVEKALGKHGKGERQLEHEAAAYFASPITEAWDVVKDCIISTFDKIAGLMRRRP